MLMRGRSAEGSSTLLRAVQAPHASEESWMSPTFYHHCPKSMDNPWKEDSGPGWKWKGVMVLLLLVIVGLTIPLAIYRVRANSEVRQQGLRVERECRNATLLLRQELGRAQDDLLRAEAQAASCNRTVETLTTSLEEQKAQNRNQEEHLLELQGEITKLKQLLQDTSAELEQLRREKASSRAAAESSAASTPGPAVLLPAAAVLLPLGLGALRP